MELRRVDYISVKGTQRGAIALCPTNDRWPLAVGDTAGQLQLLHLELQGTIAVWSKKLRSINALRLVKRPHSEGIYVASGSYIQAFSSSGSELLTVDTNMTENILSFAAAGDELWVAGKYLYSHLLGGRDLDYMVLSDLINDTEVAVLEGEDSLLAILACQDKTVRVIENGHVLHAQPLPAAPAVLKQSDNTSEVLYALSNGGLGLLHLARDKPVVLWHLALEGREPSGVSVFDLTENGDKELIIGRNDGTINILASDNGVYTELNSLKLPEPVTAAVAGKPRGRPEVVCSTYSGKILGLSSSEAPAGDYSQVQLLQSEIEDLQLAIEGTAVHEGELSPALAAKTAHRLHLLGEEAAYLLIIETQSPIEMLCLQSGVPLEILNAVESPATVNVIYSDSEVLATYKFPDNSHNSSEIKFKSTEGQSGEIYVYVVPSSLHKIAQQLKIELKPLSLHEKIPQITESEHPLNVLRISGRFSKNEMHGWVSQTLPDVPPHSLEDEISLSYCSCVLGTVLQLNYSQNSAEFKSESVSVLAILKDSINSHASFRKIHLDTQFIEDPDSHLCVLEAIDGQLAELQELDTSAQLIEALTEIDNQGDLEKFSEDIKSVFVRREEILRGREKKPKKLQYLQGVVTDLYVDLCKFRGVHSVAMKIPELQHLLGNYSFDRILEFFRSLQFP